MCNYFVGISICVCQFFGVSITLFESWLTSIFAELQLLLEHFSTKRKSNSEMLALWLEYCQTVFLLLDFLAAEWDSNWIQHIGAFQQMICHDAAFDNYRYFKWGIVYLLDTKNSPRSLRNVFMWVSYRFQEKNEILI